MILLAVLAAAAVPAIRPPLDRPLTVTTQQTRQVTGARPRRFAIARRITFHATPTGFVAEVRTLRVAGDPGDAAGERLVRMAASQVRQVVRVTLDAAGHPVAIERQAALWADLVAAIAQAGKGAKGAAQPAMATVVASLDALPAAKQVALLASSVTAILPRDVPSGGVAAHGVTIPARWPDGRVAALAGTESATVDAQGRVTLRRSASGTAGVGERLSVETQAVADPATGLLLSSRETLVTAAGGASETIVKQLSVR